MASRTRKSPPTPIKSRIPKPRTRRHKKRGPPPPSPPSHIIIPATPPTRVSTVLTPLERIHVNSTSEGAFTPIHRSSMEEVLTDLREQRADAVLLSVARYDSSSTARMASMVREFPRIPAFALLTDVHRATPHSVLSLGQLGIRTLIDARQATGWSKLKTLLVSEHSTDIQRIALNTLNRDLANAHLDCWRFFELILAHRPHIITVRQIARLLNVLPASLVSRFYRASLPSPKTYIDFLRLVRAAKLFENPGVSIAIAAKHLEYSSPQAFGRHLKMLLGTTPSHFRKNYTGCSMLQKFREALIFPFRAQLNTFRPLGGTANEPPPAMVQELPAPPL